jgi:sulfatase maturation enzyme AslB (radical SAM superfamily)
MLKLESWLEITTVSNCVIDCRFCPQHVFQEHYHGYKTLRLNDFKVALSKVPCHVVIHFSGFAEPFLNPNCLEMIEHTHDEGFKVVLFSTLFGLKNEDVERLKRCNVELVLHLPDALGNAKIPVTEEYKKTLVTALKELRTTTLYVMDEQFISNERAGLCEDAPKRHARGWFWCEKLLVPQFVMLPNCDVVLCCMDFGLSHKLGNLKMQSWLDLVNSAQYKRARANRFQMDGSTICRKCVWASARYRCTYYAKRLVQRYHAKRFIQRYMTK